MAWLDTAKRFSVALQAAQAKFGAAMLESIPSTTGTYRWALSLVLALWWGRRRRQPDVQAAIADRVLRLEPLLDQIERMSALFPSGLLTGLQTAAEADRASTEDPMIAAARVYVQRTIGDNPTLADGIVTWMRGLQFTTVAAALVTRFVEAELTVQVQSSVATASKSRADSFDRDGRTTRQPRTVDLTSVQAPAIELTGEDIARASLATLGWNHTDLARLDAGPQRGQWSAVNVYRGYVALPEVEKSKLVAQLKTRGAMSRADPALVTDLAGAASYTLEGQHTYPNAIELYKDFTELPDLEQSRFVTLVSERDRKRLA